ncbi:MAG TPA: SusC/RagA family TonB-linked outer membrane protein [Pedobacter sp.]|nr:SusC/RagA family TonB-linked outer membrane protein [Pedobacter sp.]
MTKPYLIFKAKGNWIKKLGLTFLFSYCLIFSLSAQITSPTTNNVSPKKGLVLDGNNEPIKDAIVTNKKTGKIVITDKNGNYDYLATEGDILEFNIPGFISKQYKATTNPLTISIDEVISKKETFNALYNTRKKSTNIQSFGEAFTNDLTTTPSASYLNALSGRIAGLNTLQATGEPGSDVAGVSLRGVGPIMLINGVPRNYDSIDPEEIESITVLKDALSTIMLGQRSSRGVISIKTRQGQLGKQRISFTAQTAWQQATALPKPLSAYNYASLYNEALINDGKTPVYSAADLQAYSDHSDPVKYPDVNWYDEILKKNSPFTRYNLNTYGGGNNARYFVSLDYLTQEGLYKTSSDNAYNTNVDYKRYLIRSNIDIDITPKLVLNLNLFGSIENGNYPGGGGIIPSIGTTPRNAYPIFNPDGSLGGNNNFQNNIWGLSTRSGYNLSYTRQIAADLSLKRSLNDLIEGLYVKGSVSFNTGLGDETSRTKTFAVYNAIDNGSGSYTYQKFKTDGTQNAGSSTNVLQSKNLYSELQLGYDRSFNKHNINLLLNANVQNEFPNRADLPLNYSNLAGSFHYNFDEKYMFEVAMSYSGLNRYPVGKRFGFFPAVGAAWNIHKEDFVLNNATWISNLKLRASYGKTGNANPGYFIYDQYYVDGVGYYFGTGATYNYSKIETSLANPNITWEKAKKLNIGLDVALFKDKLSFTADFYQHKFTDLLQIRGKSSSIIGIAFPVENIGKTNYSGLDFSATYRNKIQKFNYFLTTTVTANKSKIIYQDEPQREYGWMQRTGQSASQTFGYVATGFFQNQQEINSSAKIAGYIPVPGDIKYQDLNGDGIINQLDITSLRSNKPMVYYGLSFGFNVKGFDFSALIQGVENRTIYVSGATEWEFQNNGLGNAFEHHLDRWTPGTANVATYPRLSVGSNVNNQVTSSFWLRDGKYVRLKNIEVGYTLPNSIASKIKLNTIRVFANGLNVLTNSAFDRVDPETVGNIYPAQKVINMGVNIKF